MTDDKANSLPPARASGDVGNSRQRTTGSSPRGQPTNQSLHAWRELLLTLVQQTEGKPLRKNGNELLYCCPFHPDLDPSLSINVAKGVFFCHGCGAKGNAVEWIRRRKNLTHDDARREAAQLVKGAVPPIPGGSASKSFPGRDKPLSDTALPIGEHVSLYTYRKANGDTHAVVCRWDEPGKDKKIRQLTPHPDRPGRYAWKGAKAPHPLYRLPELLKARFSPWCLVPEGEKAVAALHKLFGGHLPLTCWIGGAKNWAKTDYAPLTGRRVILLADADDEGRNCMIALARHLQEHHPCHLRLHLPPPDTPRGEDAADWVAAGLTKENVWNKLKSETVKYTEL